MMPEFRPENLAKWTKGEWSSLPRTPPSGISHDTRAIRPGDIYIAIAGERFDGHRFLADAFDRGASAAVVESARIGADEWPLLRVEDTRKALAMIAHGHRGRLKGRVCGISGSVGKTTVKEMLAAILALDGAVCASRGNWNNDIGLPLSLLRMETGDSYGVFEVAMNRPGEIAALASILEPDCGIITSVGLAHSRDFADVEAIAQEKSNLLKSLPESGFAVLSRDEEFFDLFRAASAARVVGVSLSAAAGYAARLDADGMLVIAANGDEFSLRLAQPGEHIARDALLAAAAAMEMGIDTEKIRAGLEAFESLPQRGVSVEWRGIEIVDDAYNANPLSMRASLRTLARRACGGRRWAVLGTMNELGRMSAAAHEELGREVVGAADRLIGVDAGGETIVAGAQAAGMSAEDTRICADADAAAEILAHELEKGDCVLLKASRSLRLERVLDRLRALGEEHGDCAVESSNYH